MNELIKLIKSEISIKNKNRKRNKNISQLQVWKVMCMYN